MERLGFLYAGKTEVHKDLGGGGPTRQISSCGPTKECILSMIQEEKNGRSG